MKLAGFWRVVLDVLLCSMDDFAVPPCRKIQILPICFRYGEFVKVGRRVASAKLYPSMSRNKLLSICRFRLVCLGSNPRQKSINSLICAFRCLPLSERNASLSIDFRYGDFVKVNESFFPTPNKHKILFTIYQQYGVFVKTDTLPLDSPIYTFTTYNQ